MADASKVREPFPDVFGLSDYEPPPPRTLTELGMIKLSAGLRSKPEWWLKYTDPEIRAKWREEALGTRLVWIERATMLVPYGDGEQYFAGITANQQHSLEESIVQLGENEVDYVIDELGGYAKMRDEKTGIQVSCFEGVWHSDNLIDEDLLVWLKKGVSVLEDVPESQKDWHPDSDDQVLDLVHPSLYCVVYGRTLAVPRGNGPSSGKAYTLSSPYSNTHYDSHPLTSKRFQWLPTDFSITADGKAKAHGYINNLHPSHTELYKAIEGILGAFVPLFDRVLTDMCRPLPLRILGSYSLLQDLDPNYPKDKGADDYYERLDEYMERWADNRISGLPELPEEGYTGGLEKREEVVSLLGRTVQVIIKLANIHLTPDEPEYKGGSWHIEGMVNERIVSSGIYYYDQENITESELAFRIAVDDPEMAKMIQADSYDYYAHYKTWGMIMDYANSTKLTNVVGATATLQGRCLAFPNIYQHRVSPFRLADPSKSGYRKILAFFLVDPNLPEPIPSTSIVAPQQQSWVKRVLHEEKPTPSSILHRLPVELFNIILKNSDIMDDEEAKELRLELMNERKRNAEAEEDIYEGLFARHFNLCEH